MIPAHHKEQPFISCQHKQGYDNTADESDLVSAMHRRIEQLFSARVGLGSLIHHHASNICSDEDGLIRLETILSDWFFPNNGIDYSLPLNEHIVAEGIEHPLSGQLITAVARISDSFRKKWRHHAELAELDQDESDWLFHLMIERPSNLNIVLSESCGALLPKAVQKMPENYGMFWRNKETIAQFLRLPWSIRQNIAFLPQPNTRSQLVKSVGFAAGAEQASIWYKKIIVDAGLILPLALSPELLTELESMGLEALAYTIIAVLAAEFLVYHSQMKSLKNKQTCTRTVPTIANQLFMIKPWIASLVGRATGKLGKVELVILLLFSAATESPFLSLVIISELMAAKALLPDVFVNYAVAAKAEWLKQKNSSAQPLTR